MRFSIFLLCSCVIGSDIPECIANFKSCCEGYEWNSKTNTCEVCMPGYNGLNCTKKCPFPTYGKRCQLLCKCNEEDCDASTGCSSLFNGNTTTSMVTHGSKILNESSTRLILNTAASAYCTIAKSSTENKTVLLSIKLVGILGATLVFINIFLYVYDHLERKRLIPTNHKYLINNSSII